MVTEYVTLPRSPTDEQLSALTQLAGGAACQVQRGQDAQGVSRVIVAITHEDGDTVALARQHLLRACQQANIRAFVV